MDSNQGGSDTDALVRGTHAPAFAKDGGFASACFHTAIPTVRQGKVHYGQRPLERPGSYPWLHVKGLHRTVAASTPGPKVRAGHGHAVVSQNLAAAARERAGLVNLVGACPVGARSGRLRRCRGW